MALLDKPPTPGTRTAALDRIRAALPDLAPAERRVADRILEDPSQAIALSIGEFAELVGVAQPTVSRFCRNVGFPGYAALRLGVANDFAADSHNARDVAGDPLGGLGDRLRSDANLKLAAQALRAARQVEIWTTAQLASAGAVLAAGLAGLSVRAAHSAIPAHWPSRARGLEPGSVVALLTYDGTEFGAEPGVEAARGAGAKIVYIAALPARPLLKSADISVPLPEGPGGGLAGAELIGLLLAETMTDSVRELSALAGPPGPVSPWRARPARTVFLPGGPATGGEPIPSIHITAPASVRRQTLVVFYNGFSAPKEQGLPPGAPNNRVSPNIVAGLLNAGHDVLIPEMPGHGERKRAWEEVAALHRESFTGHGPDLLAMAREESPLIVDGILAMGLVSDPAGLAVVGQSWGGFHAIAKLAADPRIRCGAAIMPVCDVTVLPNFADLGAEPRVRAGNLGADLGPGLASRPLLIIAGGRDTLCTPEHIAAFVSGVSPAYAKAGTEDRLQHILLDEAGHEFDARQVDGVLTLLDRDLRSGTAGESDESP
jgi:DNA-binding MurR/RpiR family transcriptional regulator/dienelactone hydrolase